MRVLLVEDDVDLSRQLKTALSDAGYAVDHAPDGEEAWFLGDTEPYDVVVLDLGLPKIDGVSVLERWRREGKTTPVLILTARAAWSDIEVFVGRLRKKIGSDRIETVRGLGYRLSPLAGESDAG